MPRRKTIRDQIIDVFMSHETYDDRGELILYVDAKSLFDEIYPLLADDLDRVYEEGFEDGQKKPRSRHAYMD